VEPESTFPIRTAPQGPSGASWQQYATRRGKIILSHVLSLDQIDRLKLCLQMGVTHVVSTPSLADIGPDQYVAAMRKHKEAWAEAGFQVAVYETMTPVPADNIKRGTPGRDQELRNWIAAVEAMGTVGISRLVLQPGPRGKANRYGCHARRSHLNRP